ncbi:hypothetical protein [Streptomyces sp. NPDC096132]|uniref:hypothetical protein n=1 Tax=Streptomyces sp. NPDC096132 TaxID=3366075 RepID=UPI0038099C91
MRTLRKAGLVAAMIGSLTLAGAGVASAYDGGDNQNCVQTGEVQVGLVNLSDVNLGLNALNLLDFGPKSQDASDSNQFSCVNGEGNYTAQVHGDGDKGSGHKHG